MNSIVYGGKKIALIVPVYNLEQYIGECLHSIKVQDYENFNVIIVNDGSTDLSSEIIKKFCDSDKRFILVNQENKGLGCARNKGLDIVERGDYDYVSFIDGDDIVPSFYISRLLSVSVETQSDLTICSYLPFTNSEEERKLYHLNVCEPKFFSLDEYIEFVFGQGRWRKKFGSGGMVCRSLIDFRKIRGIKFLEDRELVEDELFCLKCSLKFNKIAFISDQIYGYRQREGSLVKSAQFLRRLFDGRKKAFSISEKISNHAHKIVAIACADVGVDILKRGGNISYSDIRKIQPILMSINAEKFGTQILFREVSLLCNYPALFKLYLIKKRLSKIMRFWG